MKLVYVARKWRSVRSRTSSKVILIMLFCVLFFLIRYLVISLRRKEPTPLIDYTGVWQSDPELISYMREGLILPPTFEDVFDLDHPEKDDFSEHGQSLLLAKILRGIEGGFFIEAAAGDGERSSISLYFERNLEWSGLLVEDDFDTFVNLTHKNRQSYVLHARVSTTETVKMIDDRSDATYNASPVEVSWDIPVYSLFLAMGPPQIDLLILDTTGTELEILQTIPWQSMQVDVLCVAYRHLPGNPRSLPEYLSRQGFTLLQTHVKDMFFARNEFLREQEHGFSN